MRWKEKGARTICCLKTVLTAFLFLFCFRRVRLQFRLAARHKATFATRGTRKWVDFGFALWYSCPVWLYATLFFDIQQSSAAACRRSSVRAADDGCGGILHGVKHCRAKLLAGRAPPTGEGIAIIAYTVEDYQPQRAEFCTKTCVSTCKMWKRKTGPRDNTTWYRYDDAGRQTSQKHYFPKQRPI